MKDRQQNGQKKKEKKTNNDIYSTTLTTNSRWLTLVLLFFSAGIGRTGVLITMETAMCLIEANQPVYPLSIVRQMRDQRAMLIQTAVSH
jgi:protein tyrosine phosphatase